MAKKFYIHKDKTDEKTPAWQELLDHKYSLKFVINTICQNIKILNGRSPDTLNYEDFFNENNFGLTTIVIGGDKLSRGITLDGLCVSYFLRSAKMPMYDTLMQMGRWFGYRVGYEDLYRVYCPKALHILFRQFSFSMESAREKFRELMNLKLDPEDYAIEVPCFPGWNLVSKSKSKDITIVKEPFSSVFAQNHQTIEQQ